METWFMNLQLKLFWLFANGDDFMDESDEFAEAPLAKVAETLSLKWLIIIVSIALLGFFIYRLIDLLQYSFIKKATFPTDLEKLEEEVFNAKKKKKVGRFWKTFLSRSASWGIQFGYVIGGMPLIVITAKNYDLPNGTIYMLLMGFGWFLNMFLTKMFSLWTPALPFQQHVHGKSWRLGFVLWQAWGVISWAGPVYFLAAQGSSGWMGSVAFLWISQVAQLFFFIYTTKKKIVPYQQYEGLSAEFKSNLQKYLATQDISDDTVGVIRNSKMGPNAFATGIFGYRVIAITEELIKGYPDPSNPKFTLKLPDDALEAVVAHEVGHIKGFHVMKAVFVGALISSLTTIAIFYLFSEGAYFAKNPDYFFFDKGTSAQIMSLFGQSLFNIVLMYPITFLMISLTRFNEWNADTHLLETNGCKNGHEFFHQIRHIAPVKNHPAWSRLNMTHPAPHEREERMLKWKEEHCKDKKEQTAEEET